jgi:hypothetical protein
MFTNLYVAFTDKGIEHKVPLTIGETKGGNPRLEVPANDDTLTGKLYFKATPKPEKASKASKDRNGAVTVHSEVEELRGMLNTLTSAVAALAKQGKK